VGIKRAQRYIKAGKAEMVGPLLRFIEEHHAHRSVVENFEIRHTQGGYDRVRRRMTDREMKAIPIINPHEMLAPVGRLVQKPKRMSVAAVNGRCL
jgi:hypothetical protein